VGSFFKDQPDFFQFVPEGISVSSAGLFIEAKGYPAPIRYGVFDYKTGGIKAMVGGRTIEGRLLFNRATSPRQPGSSIKPWEVYGRPFS
jgi:penicillin-binding protein 1A